MMMQRVQLSGKAASVGGLTSPIKMRGQHEKPSRNDQRTYCPGGHFGFLFRGVSAHSTPQFINPSLRDYLTDYLDDVDLLATFASCAQKVDWAQSLWKHARVTKMLSTSQEEFIARAFKPIARMFAELPMWKQDSADPSTYRLHDLCLTDRITLLLSWAIVGEDAEFASYALKIAEEPAGGFSAWRDGRAIVKLIRSLSDGDDAVLDCATELAEKLKDELIAMFRGHMWPDDLERIYEAVEDERDLVGSNLFDAANEAVIQGFDDARENAASIDSESTLEDHIKAFERLAPRVGVPEERLKKAVSDIKGRIAEIGETVEGSIVA